MFPARDDWVSEVTKCSTSMSSSRTPTWVTIPGWSWRWRSRTTMVRLTDSRRAKNSASETMCRFLRDSSRISMRRRRWASSRVEPLSARGSEMKSSSSSSSSVMSSSSMISESRSSVLLLRPRPVPRLPRRRFGRSSSSSSYSNGSVWSVGVGAVGIVGAVNEGATKSGVVYPGSSTVSGSGAWVAFSAAGFAAGVSSVRIPCSMRWLMSRWAFSLSWLSSFSTFFSTR